MPVPAPVPVAALVAVAVAALVAERALAPIQKWALGPVQALHRHRLRKLQAFPR